MLEVPYIKTVSQWCLDYWDQYEKAPAQDMKDVFRGKIRRGEVPDTEQEAIEEFLSSLSDEWEHKEFNSEYWADEAQNYLEQRSLLALAQDVEALAQRGDLGEARGKLKEAKPVMRPSGNAVDPMTSKELIAKAFEETAEPLFTFPGAFGEFSNPLLTRGSLIGIIAPEKRGKTWFLMEFALQAAKSGCNVAFFSCGDMTAPQMVKRLTSRLSGRNYMQSQTGPTRYPVLDCFHNQTGECSLPDRTNEIPVRSKDQGGGYTDPLSKYREMNFDGYKPCTACRHISDSKWRPEIWWVDKDTHFLTAAHAEKVGEDFVRRYGSRLRLFTYEAGELTSQQIQTDLENLRDHQDFTVDVVVIDYADLMGVEDKKINELRHRQNATWTALSALRSRWHICIITATQANREAYDAKTIGMGHASEDKRKISHVTGMLALNQTDSEKERGIMRVGMVVARELDFTRSKQVHVLQCLRMGRPIVGSYFKKEKIDD